MEGFDVGSDEGKDNLDIMRPIDSQGGILPMLDEEITVPRATDPGSRGIHSSSTRTSNGLCLACLPYAREGRLFDFPHLRAPVLWCCIARPGAGVDARFVVTGFGACTRVAPFFRTARA